MGLKGECNSEEIALMNQFILKRRNKIFGQNKDGKLLTKEQIKTFFDSPKIDNILHNNDQKAYDQLGN